MKRNQRQGAQAFHFHKPYGFQQKTKERISISLSCSHTQTMGEENEEMKDDEKELSNIQHFKAEKEEAEKSRRKKNTIGLCVFGFPLSHILCVLSLSIAPISSVSMCVCVFFLFFLLVEQINGSQHCIWATECQLKELSWYMFCSFICS